MIGGGVLWSMFGIGFFVRGKYGFVGLWVVVIGFMEIYICLG